MSKKPIVYTRTKFNRDWNEYTVRLFVDGNYQAGSDYHTDEKEDATETAVAMVAQCIANGCHDTTKEKKVSSEVAEIRKDELLAYRGIEL